MKLEKDIILKINEFGFCTNNLGLFYGELGLSFIYEENKHIQQILDNLKHLKGTTLSEGRYIFDVAHAVRFIFVNLFQYEIKNINPIWLFKKH